MPTIGDLVVNLTANTAGFTRPMVSATGLVTGLAAAGATLATGGLLPIKLAADAESTAAAFETLAGSVESAQTLLGQLETFSASTPFQQDDLNEAARQLLAFGRGVDQVMGDMQTLGDIAAGTQKPLLDFVDIFGKVKASGVASLADINRLGDRGVPIYRLLAEVMGVAESEIRGLAGQSKIGFAEIQAALQAATKEGEIFAGGMERQSRTLNGLWSTFKDNVSIKLRQIGQEINQHLDLKDVVSGAIELVRTAGDLAVGFSKWSRTIATTIAILVSMKVAMWAIVAAQKAIAAAQVIVQALSGPKGWIAIAAGIAIAAAAVSDLDARFDDLTASARTSQAATAAADATQRSAASGVRDQLTPAFKDAMAVVQNYADRIADLRDVQEALPELGAQFESREIEKFTGDFTAALRALQQSREAANPINALKDALGDLDATAALIGDGPLNDLGSVIVDEIGKLSGVTDQIKQARNELAKLQGLKTDIDIAVEDALSRGALPQQAEELRELLERAERITEGKRQDEERQRRRESEQDRRESLAQSIFDKTRTPLEKLSKEIGELELLKQQGLLGDDTFARAIAQAGEQARQGILAQKPDAQEPDRLAKALQFGTGEAFDAITRAMGGGAGESDQKKTAKATQEIAEVSELISETLEDIKQNTKPNKDKPITIGSR